MNWSSTFQVLVYRPFCPLFDWPLLAISIFCILSPFDNLKSSVTISSKVHFVAQSFLEDLLSARSVDLYWA